MPAVDGDAVIRPQVFVPTSRQARPPWWRRYGVRIALGIVTVVVATVVWYLFTARSVRIELTPADAALEIHGAFDLALGGTWVLREGQYRLTASADGFFDLDAPLMVDDAEYQTYRFELKPLPGRVDFISNPAGAVVFIDGERIGVTPLGAIEIAAGEHDLEIVERRHVSHIAKLDVVGRGTAQQVEVILEPNWADVTIASTPAGAQVLIDDENIGVTPGTFEVVAGTRELRIKLPRHKSAVEQLTVAARQALTLPPFVLQPADALLTVRSAPTGVAVTVDGRYQGTTPLEVALAPGREHAVRLSKAGYAAATRRVTLQATDERTLEVQLDALLGTVMITATPADAEVWVDGVARGAVRRLQLPARSHRLEFKRAGYESQAKEVTPQPNITQQLAVRLLTHAEARLAKLVPRIKHPAGGEMLLFDGGAVTMGASRREPGRRANETLRTVNVTRLFYLATTEVTNGQFRQFAKAHSSGKFEEQELDKDDQPVANVTWLEAALFCNWLSERARLPVFYRVEFGKVVGFNAKATGFRLPTEAEWSWTARTRPDGSPTQRFPWGDALPPPERFGNYADRSASHVLGRIVFGYNDNFIVSAPVATFAADARGLFDLSGNVAEWVNDFYEIPSEAAASDPLGPASGDYHVIRGSSWMHGTITDLRTSFRDYGEDGRPDLGFRIARFAE